MEVLDLADQEYNDADLFPLVEGIKEKSVSARAAVEARQAVIKANAEAKKAHVRGDGQGAC